MNKFESFLLDIAESVVAVAPAVVPIAVHSPSGLAYFNVSEAFAAQLLNRLTAPKPQAVPTPNPPAV